MWLPVTRACCPVRLQFAVCGDGSAPDFVAVSMFLCMCAFKENKTIYFFLTDLFYYLCMCLSICRYVPVLVGVPRDQKRELGCRHL